MRKILLTCFMLVFVFYAWAQDRTVSGTVTDSDTGESLPGVNVLLKGTGTGVNTDIDGNFKISVPEEGGVLVFSFIGMATKEIEVGSRSVVDVALESDIRQLSEVVVTGVAEGTSTKKLGFSVAKVNEDALQKVPAVDAGNALRGKAAGVRVVQPSGNPSTSAEIRLRGSTNISGSQSPLIIVDGIITNGSLNDINMADVKSMEVIKGAAASSLYGSLAGNGVIQILTKRGAEKSGKPVFKVRSEYGMSQLARNYPVAQRHWWLLNEDGSFALDNNGKVQQDPDGLVDNPYPIYNDNANNLFTAQPWFTNNVSLAGTDDKFNYFMSYQNMRQEGIIEGLDPYIRNSVRANMDYLASEKLTIKTSVSYVRTNGTNVTEQGQSPNLFYGVLIYEPYLNLAEKTDDGEFAVTPEGYDVFNASNFRNPFYQATNYENSFDRERFLGGVNLEYKPFDWMKLSGKYSIDNQYRVNEVYYPDGFETATPSSTINNGNISIQDRKWETKITQLSANFNKKFDNLGTSLTVSYLLEDRSYFYKGSSSYDFLAKGVKTLQNGRQTTYSIGSTIQDEIAENVFVNLDIDYDDKIIASGLVRRDGSSLFGEEERYQTYFRGSLAYRLTEDFSIPGINEWKLRASYGTSGQRPYAWAAQYETFSVTASGITPQILGNNALKPSVVTEIEVGTNISFLNKFSAEVNYALSNTEDDVLLVPLSPVTGYVAQYQNAGSLESAALEASLSGNILKTSNFSWDFNLNFDKITQTIGELQTAPFTRNTGTALPLFRVEEGLPYGTIFGNQIVTNVSELTLDEDGFVMNDSEYAPGGTNNVTPDMLIKNEDGYLVRKDYYNTAEEQAMVILDEETGVAKTTAIGDTNPDFNIGASTTATWKGLSLYVLVDYQQGGDIYNYTKQLLYFENRHKDNVDYALIGKHSNYSGGASVIYNAGQLPISHFVEDGSFVKLREVSLSYDLPLKSFGNVSDYLRGARLSLSGRNIFTFTNYSGWDPEIALNNNPTNFRIDEFSYPNFRTYTATIELTF